jgi:uncharacterized delta-60 repeat protein
LPGTDWNEAEDAFVNVNGQWKIAKSAWANLNGTWEQTHVLEVLDKFYRSTPPGDGFNTTVFTIVIQSDGKILVGGFFYELNGITRNYLVRLNADGTVDTAFYTNLGTGFDNAVFTIAIQSDGKILVGGDFTTLNGVTRSRLVRLNADGTVDTAFYTNMGTGINSSVNALAIQSDGKILVGGQFGTLNGITRNYLVRLNADGTVDTAFYTNLGTGFNSNVNTRAIQSDGKILVGGTFTTLNNLGRRFFVVLSPSGVDETPLSFYDNFGFDSTVFTTAIQSDGKILVGGSFTALNGTLRNRLVRLNTDGTVDTAFYTNLGTGIIKGFNNNVTTLAIQSDGKILVGGTFTALGGETRNRLVRLNTDGTVDTAFSTNLGTGFSSNVNTIAIQSDGKILVGGTFNTLNFTTRNRLVRLNTNGTVDTAFSTNLGTGFNNTVNTLAIQSDGKILVGGLFTALKGTTRNRLVRLNADGTEDTAFYTNLGTGFANVVITIAIQSDGKILVGGLFTTFKGTFRNRLVRLNTDGTEDTAFYTNLGTGVGSNVITIAIQSDGKILVGGTFTTLNGITRNRLVRLNAAGTVDTAFSTNLGAGFNSTVNTIAIQSDGKILVGGLFIALNSTTRNRLVRLNTDGTDAALSITNYLGFGSIVWSLAIQSDDKILVGGQFTTFNGTFRNRLVRLNTDGTEDTAFYTNLGTGFDNAVFTIAIQSDGKIIVGGQFTTLNNLGRRFFVVLSPSGVDETPLSFYGNFGFDSTAFTTAIQSDGKILVGGTFTALNGTTRNRLVRLNTDGTVDTAFYTNLGTGFNSNVNTIAIQPDDKILVGGQFTTLNGITRNRLVRLNTDGTVDTAFYTNLGTGFNSTVTTIAIQSDGKILVGGGFTTLNGVTRNRLVRLNADGTVDTAFYTNLGTGFGKTVSTIAIQTDGKILVGGGFLSLNGVARNRLVRLNADGTLDTALSIGTGFGNTVTTIAIQSDGKILVGGAFTTLNGVTRNRLVRLNADGTVDTAFYTNLGTGFGNTVTTIAIQSDGKILVGGTFTALNGITRNRLVRLNTDGTVDTAFSTNLGTGFDSTVNTIAIQSDGKILVGGAFKYFTTKFFAPFFAVIKAI